MKEEFFDIIDESGRPVGRTAPRSEVHGDPGLVHRSVHVLVLDRENRLFLQKRSEDKDIQPGKWDSSVGGHVARGEEVFEAAEREMAEEIGVRGRKLEFMYSYIWRTEVETELVTSYLCRYDGPFRTDPAEIEDGRFWSFGEIEKTLGSGVFTPNFEEEFVRLKELLEKAG
ncbi:MAG: NUDIX domain-containing protein [Gemmatimonadota bacterium]|nr:NUDIX domain-containing protein [Gemmatimonadota bacterium]